MRTLIETLGDAYCESLRRTAIGALRVPAAGEEEVDAERALGFLPERQLSDEEADRVGHGVAVVGRHGAQRRRRDPARPTRDG